MLAIGRALLSKPKFLMLDEPSLGIAPLLVKTIFERIVEINREQGLTILLVEQNANLALDISSYAYVLETGKILLEGPSAQVKADPAGAGGLSWSVNRERGIHSARTVRCSLRLPMPPSRQQENRNPHAQQDADHRDGPQADQRVAGGKHQRSEANDVRRPAEQQRLAGALARAP